jgi:glutathione S-transferase
MKLYYAPGTSALGIRILLEEIGRPYEITTLDFSVREQYHPAFTAINPKSKVPTLVRDDGTVLTEFGAIARWLSRFYPEADLLPHDGESEARAIELLDYVVGTVHMRGFSRLFFPAAFGSSEEQYTDILIAGGKIAATGFEIIDAGLAGRTYVAGRHCFADAALFYVEHWAQRVSLPLLANCARHYAMMLERPAVQRALESDERISTPTAPIPRGFPI